MKNKTANKFGVKVGDYFFASWGYDQTNVDWFQVVALAGESSVRVREVNPPVIESTAINDMSGDYVFDLDTSKLLPPAPRSTWIKDQEKGDLKRLRNYPQWGFQDASFYMASFADAYHCTARTKKAYISSYA